MIFTPGFIKTQIKYARKLSCYHAMVAASIKRIRHMYFLLHDAIILANFETVLSTLLLIAIMPVYLGGNIAKNV